MSQKAGTEDRPFEDTSIIDVDVHLDPDEDEVAKYCDDLYSKPLTNDSAFPRAPGSDWARPELDLEEAERLTTPERVQSLVCDRLGVDYPLLNLDTGIQKLPNPDTAVHLMEAYNDYLLDQFLDDTGFHALAEITTQQPDRAAEEIERLGDEKQIVGVLLGTTGPEKPLGDPRYDVLYRAAEDNDLPIVYHPAGAGPLFRHDYSKQNQGFTTRFGIDTLSGLWSQSMTCTSLLVQGVPEKFPDLDFVFLETGASWAPYMMWRLNKEYSIQKLGAPLLTQSPEKYARESFYFSSHSFGAPENPEDLRTFVDIMGPELLLFSSNAPYSEYDGRRQLAEDLRDTYCEDELAQILHGTAADVFDLPT